jgi:hypothetical protein
MAMNLSVSGKKDRILQFRLALFSGRRSVNLTTAVTAIIEITKIDQKISNFFRNFCTVKGKNRNTIGGEAEIFIP